MRAIRRFREARQKFEIDLKKEISDSTWVSVVSKIYEIREITSDIARIILNEAEKEEEEKKSRE